MPFVSELRMFPWGTIPPGWIPCDGRVLPISRYQPLYSLLGTTYGGDGQTTFAVPDLRGRVPLGAAPRVPAGQRGGEEAHTLTVAETPGHHHAVMASASPGNTSEPKGAVLAGAAVWGQPADLTPLQGATVAATGGGQPHPNMQPSLVLNVCIAAQGYFPSPS
jgi:microcystin-dependent protein